MKLTNLFALSMGLTLGLATAGETMSYWAEGVSEMGGWYDANKLDNNDGDADDLMCYAASASNLIAWWQNGEAGSQLTSTAPSDLEEIWQAFVGANKLPDEGGEALAAINWWISGVYFPEGQDDAEWERYYLTPEDMDGDTLSVTLRGSDGYYFDEYGLNSSKLSHFLVDFSMYDIGITQVDYADVLSKGYGISLAIQVDIAGVSLGHAITLWGVEYDESGKLISMWITDSDDQKEELLKVSVTVDEANDKIWLGDEYSTDGRYYLIGVYALLSKQSLKWAADTLLPYLDEQVNPTTRNGCAGLTLLPEVILQGEYPEDGALATIIDAVDDGLMGDSDAAAVAGASTAVLGQALTDDMERQLRAIRNRAAMGNGSRDAVVLDGKESRPEQPGKFFAWMNAEGNRAEQDADGAAAGYTLSSWGGTVGAGMLANPQLTLGLAVTAMYGDLQSDGPDCLDGDMDTAYLSAFARYQHGNWSHHFIGSVGLMDVDYKRAALNYSNNGETDGTALGLMYELGHAFVLNDWSNISPLFNIAYRHTAVDGYCERGTDAALQVGKQNLDTVTLACGARYAAMVGQQLLNRTCAFEARALVKYDLGDTQTESTVGFANFATRTSIESAERGAMGLEVGTGIAVPVGPGCIFTDGSVELRSDYTNLNATLGYKVQF
ncbi:MAG: IdeS/Mac family cysteine endopeptidase [Akkermansia sp.]|nr:IdeS/Mac family cysteine endopeptidase [Akkermansia sp.]